MTEEETKKMHKKNEINDKDSSEHKADKQKDSGLKTITEKPEQSEAKSSNKKHAQEKPKRTEAFVNAKDIPISTKHSAAICNFIKMKKISKAIIDLEQVARIKKAVPMKGEIPHRKGKMMSGRFPQKAAKEFIVLLKSLAANANYNGIEDPIVTKAIANIGARPFGGYGVRKKRTHITLVAKSVSGGKK